MNKFRASDTLPPFQKKSVSTQKVRSMPYALLSLRDWASGSDQALLEIFFDVGAQKTDGTTLDIYGMVVAAFSMTDKANRVRFFERLF